MPLRRSRFVKFEGDNIGPPQQKSNQRGIPKPKFRPVRPSNFTPLVEDDDSPHGQRPSTSIFPTQHEPVTKSTPPPASSEDPFLQLGSERPPLLWPQNNQKNVSKTNATKPSDIKKKEKRSKVPQLKGNRLDDLRHNRAKELLVKAERQSKVQAFVAAIEGNKPDLPIDLSATKSNEVADWIPFGESAQELNAWQGEKDASIWLPLQSEPADQLQQQGSDMESPSYDLPVVSSEVSQDSSDTLQNSDPTITSDSRHLKSSHNGDMNSMKIQYSANTVNPSWESYEGHVIKRQTDVSMDLKESDKGCFNSSATRISQHASLSGPWPNLAADDSLNCNIKTIDHTIVKLEEVSETCQKEIHSKAHLSNAVTFHGTTQLEEPIPVLQNKHVHETKPPENPKNSDLQGKQQGVHSDLANVYQQKGNVFNPQNNKTEQSPGTIPLQQSSTQPQTVSGVLENHAVIELQKNPTPQPESKNGSILNSQDQTLPRSPHQLVTEHPTRQAPFRDTGGVESSKRTTTSHKHRNHSTVPAQAKEDSFRAAQRSVKLQDSIHFRKQSPNSISLLDSASDFYSDAVSGVHSMSVVADSSARLSHTGSVIETTGSAGSVSALTNPHNPQPTRTGSSDSQEDQSDRDISQSTSRTKLEPEETGVHEEKRASSVHARAARMEQMVKERLQVMGIGAGSSSQKDSTNELDVKKSLDATSASKGLPPRKDNSIRLERSVRKRHMVPVASKPLGATTEEIEMLNKFLIVAGPKLHTSSLTMDDREAIHNMAIEAGLPEEFVNKILDQTAGIIRWEEQSIGTVQTMDSTEADITVAGSEPSLRSKHTINSEYSGSTVYTRDTEAISYDSYDMRRRTPKTEVMGGFSCFDSFKSTFWVEAGLAGDDMMDNVAAVISTDSIDSWDTRR